MPQPTTLLPLRDLARETAVEILADAAGRRRISELLAVAFLRGYSEALRDQRAVDRRIRFETAMESLKRLVEHGVMSADEAREQYAQQVSA